jgi:hypothetical protein
MVISKKRHMRLYNALTSDITELRIKIKMGEVTDMDEELFFLEQRIYKQVSEVLNLQKAPP